MKDGDQLGARLFILFHNKVASKTSILYYRNCTARLFGCRDVVNELLLQSTRHHSSSVATLRSIHFEGVGMVTSMAKIRKIWILFETIIVIIPNVQMDIESLHGARNAPM